jgi:hypothetical protein
MTSYLLAILAVGQCDSGRCPWLHSHEKIGSSYAARSALDGFIITSTSPVGTR